MPSGTLTLLAAVAASAVVITALALMAVRRRTPRPAHDPLARLGWTMEATFSATLEAGGYVADYRCIQEPRLTKYERRSRDMDTDLWKVDGRPCASLDEALDRLSLPHKRMTQ